MQKIYKMSPINSGMLSLVCELCNNWDPSSDELLAVWSRGHYFVPLVQIFKDSSNLWFNKV